MIIFWKKFAMCCILIGQDHVLSNMEISYQHSKYWTASTLLWPVTQGIGAQRLALVAKRILNTAVCHIRDAICPSNLAAIQ